VLLDMSGVDEWVIKMIQPRRNITDDGSLLMDDLLHDIAVVKHESTIMHEDDRRKI
jgi:hypothetical protein